MSQATTTQQGKGTPQYPQTVRVGRAEDAICTIITILTPRVFDDIKACQLNETVRDIAVEKHLILDMTCVDKISSQFLGVLIAASQRLHKTSRLLVAVGMNPEIREVLKITKLEKLSQLRFSGSVEEAKANFK